MWLNCGPSPEMALENASPIVLGEHAFTSFAKADTN